MASALLCKRYIDLNIYILCPSNPVPVEDKSLGKMLDHVQKCNTSMAGMQLAEQNQACKTAKLRRHFWRANNSSSK